MQRYHETTATSTTDPHGSGLSREAILATLEGQLRLLVARAQAKVPIDHRSVDNLARWFAYAFENKETSRKSLFI